MYAPSRCLKRARHLLSNVDSYCFLDWFHIDYLISQVKKCRDGRNFIGILLAYQNIIQSNSKKISLAVGVCCGGNKLHISLAFVLVRIALLRTSVLRMSKEKVQKHVNVG